MKNLKEKLGKGFAIAGLAVATSFGYGCGEGYKTEFSGKIKNMQNNEEQVTLKVKSGEEGKKDYIVACESKNKLVEYTLYCPNSTTCGEIFLDKAEVSDITYVDGEKKYGEKRPYNQSDCSITPVIEKAKERVSDYLRKINEQKPGCVKNEFEERINKGLKDLE